MRCFVVSMPPRRVAAWALAGSRLLGSESDGSEAGQRDRLNEDRRQGGDESVEQGLAHGCTVLATTDARGLVVGLRDRQVDTVA